LKKVNKRRIHNTKLVHDILPTTHQASKYDKGKQTCPQCPCEVENRIHILRCPSSSAETWHLEFQQSLLQFFQDTNTDPALTELALSVVEQWFADDSDLQLDPLLYPATVTSLIQEQNSIGWGQIFSGRFSNEWSGIQDSTYRRAPPAPDGKQKRTGTRWQAKFILKFGITGIPVGQIGTSPSTVMMQLHDHKRYARRHNANSPTYTSSATSWSPKSMRYSRNLQKIMPGSQSSPPAIGLRPIPRCSRRVFEE
jgi:hypothetical protein